MSVLASAGRPGSTDRICEVTTMGTSLAPTQACDLALGELELGGDEAHDLSIEFTVKELLVDIRQAVERASEATKAELEAVERRVTDRIVLVDAASKEREQVNSEAIKEMQAQLSTLREWKAKVAGVAAAASLLGGGAVASILQAVGN